MPFTTQDRHSGAYARRRRMPREIAGGGADAKRYAQWCAVRVAPRPLLDGLSSFSQTAITAIEA